MRKATFTHLLTKPQIGLGIFALPNYEHKNSAYSYALKSRPISEYLKNVKDIHSAVEGMLLEIGNFFEHITYTSDQNKRFDGKKLSEICSITSIPDFTYAELKNLVSKSDTVWFTRTRLLFPKYIFEVESTTNFINSMLKMYQMMNFETKFILLALETRRTLFTNCLQREPFVEKGNRFLFRSFEEVTKLYFNSVEHYEMKDKFLY